MVRSWIMAALAGLVLAASAAAQPVNSGNVEGELHSARAAVAPGERFTIVLRQNINEGWHTYWRNSGDSGEPTELTWSAPAGWIAGPLQWPAPEPAPFTTIVNYGYHGEVFFPIEISVPANARVGETVTLTAEAYWLVCSDICIPETATLTLRVPVEAVGRDDPTWAPRVQQAVAALPRQEAGVEARITAGSPARLSIALPDGGGDIRNPHFFTYDRDVMAHSEAQRPRVGAAGLSFDIPPGVAPNLGQAPVEGVVTFEQLRGGQWIRRAMEIVAQPGEALAGTAEDRAVITDDYPLAEIENAAWPAEAPQLTPLAVLVTLGLAFLAGLILNIMPCVLPVLSVKALAFAHGAHTGQARRHGVLFLAGVLTTFLALAGLLIALRAGGEALGWGFQLQEPWVIAGLALLFFVIGLNLVGVFEFGGGGVENLGAGLAARGGDLGAFFTGALAVVAATPCTAPFMGGAIGAVLTQSTLVTLLIFTFLALGFALPLTLLHFAPALQKLIPKPGDWMERVRNVLAFPMFVTAALLAWVLAEQTGSGGVLALLVVATAVGFAFFVGRWGRVWLVIGVIAVLGTAALTWRPLLGIERAAALAEEPWSPERVAQLRSEGRGVFVNFTAAWCITCKVNEGAALSSRRVALAFADEGVVYLKADWTNRDDIIAAALAEYGRVGVPLYLFYPAGGGDPVVLPQVLNENLVIETISGD